MEIFKQTNFDFLGKKWPFITLSLILTAAGLISLAVKGGPRYGIDFTGGALMEVNFIKRPPAEAIRSAIRKQVAGGIEVQEISNSQEVLISTQGRDERALEVVRRDMIAALNDAFGQKTDKLGINTTGQAFLADRLRDPIQRAGIPMSEDQLQELTKAILLYRDDTKQTGLIRNLDELSKVPGVTPAILTIIKQECYVDPYGIRRVEIVGPKIGADLRAQPSGWCSMRCWRC